MMSLGLFNLSFRNRKASTAVHTGIVNSMAKTVASGRAPMAKIHDHWPPKWKRLRQMCSPKRCVRTAARPARGSIASTMRNITALRMNSTSNGAMWRSISRTPIAIAENDSTAPLIHRTPRVLWFAPMKLDIFPHIFPRAYFERMKQIAERNPALVAQIKRWLHIPVLWDLDKRMRMMKRWPGYKQVLTLSMPAIEFLGNENETPALARLANDGMAEIVEKHPDLFPAFVASLPMNNIPAAIEEMDHAITNLGAKGVQIFTNVNGRPLDDPEFFPIFERMSKTYDLPIWVLPSRTAKFPD